MVQLFLDELDYLDSIAKELGFYFTEEQVRDRTEFAREKVKRVPNSTFWNLSLTSDLPYIPNLMIHYSVKEGVLETNVGCSSFSCSSMEEVALVGVLMRLLSGKKG